MTAIRGALAIALCMSAVTACEREKREFTSPAQSARVGAEADTGAIIRSEAYAGAIIASYERNAQALATGKRLFTWYNCNGCHASGGGGSGPALMDDVWIYGSEPMTIYLTIYGGRPNGMPAFGARIPENQIWQLVAYVRSLAGLGSRDAAPNRDDAMLGHPPEAQLDEQKPKTATPSGASSRP
jgi:cytochrome c oxidase cbb3-type subunit 3